MIRLIRVISKIIFPRRCLLCWELVAEQVLFCSTCHPQVAYLRDPACTRCAQPLDVAVTIPHPCVNCQKKPPSFDQHASLFLFNQPIAKLIHKIKYGADLTVLSLLAKQLYASHRSLIEQADYLIPVPLSKSRLRQRSFNQSVELAKKLSQFSGVPCLQDKVRKIRDTPHQTSLPRKLRLKNLRDSFRWVGDDDFLCGKKVLLLDDVYTTGATMNELAGVLKKLGPSKIFGLTLAYNALHSSDQHLP